MQKSAPICGDSQKYLTENKTVLLFPDWPQRHDRGRVRETGGTTSTGGMELVDGDWLQRSEGR
jgi:hypothetical protein